MKGHSQAQPVSAGAAVYHRSVRFYYRWREPGTYPFWVWAIVFAVFLGLSAWEFDRRDWFWAIVFLGVVLFRLPPELRAWRRSRLANRNANRPYY